MKYDDILHKSRPVSKVHPPMSRHDRAAQFAPFAALVGYDSAVRETARLTSALEERSESQREDLDQKLRILQQLPEKPVVTLTWFRPDEKKSGGSYEKLSARFQKIDTEKGLLYVEGSEIPLTELFDLNFDDDDSLNF